MRSTHAVHTSSPHSAACARCAAVGTPAVCAAGCSTVGLCTGRNGAQCDRREVGHMLERQRCNECGGVNVCSSVGGGRVWERGSVDWAHRQDAHDDGWQALPRERVLQGAQLIQQAAQRPDVRLAVVRPILQAGGAVAGT
eukprot:360986-Chlamydomonas_euryale.AAC.2